MQHLVFFLGTSFSSRVWLQCSRQDCCPKVKDQSFLLFINGVETAKIQSAIYPLSLNHPPRPPSSLRSFWSYHLATTFVSKDFYLLIFLGISLVSSAICSRSISSFLFFSNDCARRVLLELFSCVYRRCRKSETRVFVDHPLTIRYLEWKRCSYHTKISD